MSSICSWIDCVVWNKKALHCLIATHLLQPFWARHLSYIIHTSRININNAPLAISTPPYWSLCMSVLSVTVYLSVCLYMYASGSVHRSCEQRRSHFLWTTQTLPVTATAMRSTSTACSWKSARMSEKVTRVGSRNAKSWIETQQSEWDDGQACSLLFTWNDVFPSLFQLCVFSSLLLFLDC